MAEAPPKAGPGSSRDAWAEYAAQVGVEVGEDVSRDEIIEAVEAAEVEPEPSSGEVTFETYATSKRVYSPGGVQVAKFVDGQFSTDDPQLVEVLDGLPDVRRV